MNRFIWGTAAVALVASVAFFETRASGQTRARAATDSYRELLDTYCVDCHNAQLKSGNIAFDALDLRNAPDNAQVWEKAVRKMRGRLMPPPGNPQPSQKEIDAFVAWMENNLDTHPKGPRAGYVPI